jgi:molybdopterin-guanine dinucleotide biosynthesis protein A
MKRIDHPTNMLTIAIQAGGASNRMGSNKAMLPFLGKPLIARIVGRLSPIADEIFLISNQPELFGFLGIPIHTDTIPGIGPLGGLLAALTLASHPLVGIFACDMPFVNPDLVNAQADILNKENVDVVIPWIDQQYEPLHAVYRRDTCLPPVTKAIQAGSKRMISWFDAVRIHQMGVTSMQLFDPHGLSIMNVNTPEAFTLAEHLAREIEP